MQIALIFSNKRYWPKTVKKTADRKATEAEIIANWTNALPYYREILISLRDVLYHRAETNGFTIGQPSNYFQSLPFTIDPAAPEFNITQIGYKEDTNWTFVISITALKNYRILRITCSSCWIEFFRLIMPAGSIDGSNSNHLI